MTKSQPKTPAQRFLGRLTGAEQPNPPSDPPQTVTGPLGTVPGAAGQVDTTREVPPTPRLSPKDAQRLMDAELLSAMRSLVESSTELTNRIGRRGSVNSVLLVTHAVIPASGTLQWTMDATIGSARIVNHSAANTLTVQSGVPAGDTGAQSAGTGVQRINANLTHNMAVGDRSITITGTAADRVSLQLFSGMQAFGIGAL